jgi:hypothetical protein
MTMSVAHTYSIEIIQAPGSPEVWEVDAIDEDGAGVVSQIFFSGPEARERADEYVRLNFGRFADVHVA